MVRSELTIIQCVASIKVAYTVIADMVLLNLEFQMQVNGK